MELIGIEVLLKDQQFQAGLQRYMNGVKQMSNATDEGVSVMSRMSSIASGALVVGLGAATAAIGLFAAAAKTGLDATLQWGESLDKLGDQFGIAGPEAAKWATAMNHVGLSVEEGAFGLNFFTRGLAETFKVSDKGKVTLTPFGEALKKLGVNAYDAKGKLKDFDSIMPEIMDAFSKMPRGVQATDLAMQLFGARGGTKFLDFLRQGKKGLESARKMAEEFGLEIENDGVDAIEEFGFAMNDLNLEVKGLWTQIGLEVLPYARRLVDFIKGRVLPVLNSWLRDNLPKLIAKLQDFAGVIQRDVLPILTDLWGHVQRVVEAFQKGGISGVLDELGRQLQQAFKGFDLANLLGDIGGRIAKSLSDNWPKIQATLSTWGGRFWTWLTGDGGVLQAVGTQLGKVVDEMRKWVENNLPAFSSVFDQWKTAIWNWLTDPTSGVLADAATKLADFAKKLEDLARNDPEVIKGMQNVGEQLANSVIDGMSNIFNNPGKSRNLLTDLGWKLWNAALSLKNFFAATGANIASGVVKGIADRFVAPDVAFQISESIRTGLQTVLEFLLAPGGPVAEACRRIIAFILTSINDAVKSWTPAGGGGGGSGIPATPPETGGTGGLLAGAGLGLLKYQEGGFVPRTGPIYAHAGEYVLDKERARLFMPALRSATYNSRSLAVNISHTWNGNVGAMDRAQIESLVKRTTHEAVAQTLDGYKG